MVFILHIKRKFSDLDSFNKCEQIFNPLMPGGNKRSYVLEQVCSSTYDLFLPPGVKGLIEKQKTLTFTIKILNGYLHFLYNVSQPVKNQCHCL